MYTSDLQLCYVFKPHQKKLTCLEISSNLLATTSEDQTIFFFNINKNQDLKMLSTQYKFEILPLAYINLSFMANSLQFIPDILNVEQINLKNENTKVLIKSIAGELFTFNLPKKEEIETFTTYELDKTLLNFKPWKLLFDQENIISEKEKIKTKPTESTYSYKELNELSKFEGISYLSNGNFLGIVSCDNNETELRLFNLETPNSSRYFIFIKEF